MMEVMLLYWCQQTTNTTTEDNNMILSGKNLVVYKLNKVAEFALMAIGTLAFTAFMMMACIIFG